MLLPQNGSPGTRLCASPKPEPFLSSNLPGARIGCATLPMSDALPSPPAAAPPRAEIQRRLAASTARQNQLIHAVSWVSNGRLGVFMAGLGVLWLIGGPRVLSWGWIGVPIAAFLGLVLWHDRLLWRRKRATQAMEFYQASLARMDDTWKAIGSTGERFVDPGHPYAGDRPLRPPIALPAALGGADSQRRVGVGPVAQGARRPGDHRPAPASGGRVGPAARFCARPSSPWAVTSSRRSMPACSPNGARSLRRSPRPGSDRWRGYWRRRRRSRWAVGPGSTGVPCP